jgi:hypothetical protein
MGLFSAIFGGGKKSGSGSIDGMWLSGERDLNWREVAKFSDQQPIEFSQESCYTNGTGTFVILRSFNQEKNIMIFMGCIIPPTQNEFVLIVVDRHELRDGSLVKADDWTENRVLHASKYPTIVNAIASARNMAAFINYSTTPPFVMWLSTKVK